MAHPEEKEEEFVLEQHKEEVEAHKEEELCTEEESQWYRNYMKMLITYLLVPQAEEITIETPYQEDEEEVNYKQNLNIRSSNKMADQPSGRPIHHPPDDSKPYIEPDSSLDLPVSIEETKIEKKFQSKLKFLSKERNLT